MAEMGEAIGGLVGGIVVIGMANKLLGSTRPAKRRRKSRIKW